MSAAELRATPLASSEEAAEESKEAVREERARTRALRQAARAEKRALRQQERDRVLAGRGAEKPAGRRTKARRKPAPQPLTYAAATDAPCAITEPERLAERLAVFTDTQIEETRRKLGVIRLAPWPRLEGCLAVLFTSRSGSTCLARELEMAFDIGQLREALKPPKLAGRPAADLVADREGGWFSFKAGGHSVIAAEICGVFDAYLPVTSFILLLRRDIVAQAVSRVKAMQTGIYHSTSSGTPRGRAAYNEADIAKSVGLIAGGVERLRLYAERSGRPCRRLIYEDFADGDFTSPVAVCDALGVPHRAADSAIEYSPVEPIGNATNKKWAARFREEMDAETREIIERYQAEIQLAGRSQ
ncbi:MAG: Stf0 family sulfotransferase [Caulobacteraceae bacterium]